MPNQLIPNCLVVHMNPTKTLPPTHSLAWAVDMKKDRRLHWWLQVAGLAWFFVAAFLVLQAVSVLRPGFALTVDYQTVWDVLLAGLGAILIIFVTVTLHELVHGLFFWLFSKSRPQFGLGPGYAYAAAPDWYFPKGQYLVIGLAPLVLLTVLGLLAIVIVPLAWVPVLFLAIIFNAGGAIGDMYVCMRIGAEASNIWVKDTGDGFEVYRVIASSK